MPKLDKEAGYVRFSSKELHELYKNTSFSSYAPHPGDRDIEILREWASREFYDTERDECFYCKVDYCINYGNLGLGIKREEFEHNPNCPYLLAKQLLQEIDNGNN